MIRIFDLVISIVILIISLPITITIFLTSTIFTKSSPFFWQERVGLYKKPFMLIKFRTMHPSTKSVASHLVNSSSINFYGKFLRKTKLDEIPQLWNVIKGEMSIVGPRPCLFNQEELIYERDKKKIFEYLPGITGLAQINKIDMSVPKILASTDYEMMKKLNFKNYINYIFLTMIGKGFGDRTKL